MTESLIRNALKCLDIEPWQSKQRGDKIIVTASRWMAEITGQQYEKEAVAKYLAAVSPENVAGLLAVIDGLREQIKSRGYDDDIWHNIVKLHMKEPAG